MRISININLNDNENKTYAYIDEDMLPVDGFINVSNYDILDPMWEQIVPGVKGFQLSESSDNIVSTLDGSYGLFPGLNSYENIGIITRAISGSDGSFQTPVDIKFILRGSGNKCLYICFDKASGEYAQEVDFKIGDLSTHISNDSVFMPISLKEYEEYLDDYDGVVVTLNVTKWSKPNSSIKISYIGCHYNDTFYENTIKSFECSEHALGSQMRVQPGIVEQYADISLYDKYNTLHRLAEINLFDCEAEVSIDVCYDDVIQNLGRYTSKDWSVQLDPIVKLQCTDSMSRFENIFINGLNINFRSLDDLIRAVFAKIPDFEWSYLDIDTYMYCKSILLPNNWVSPDKLLNIINKICAVGMLRIYFHLNYFYVMRCY